MVLWPIGPTAAHCSQSSWVPAKLILVLQIIVFRAHCLGPIDHFVPWAIGPTTHWVLYSPLVIYTDHWSHSSYWSHSPLCFIQPTGHAYIQTVGPTAHWSHAQPIGFYTAHWSCIYTDHWSHSSLGFIQPTGHAYTDRWSHSSLVPCTAHWVLYSTLVMHIYRPLVPQLIGFYTAHWSCIYRVAPK